jgi:hypothetical protein
LSHPFGQIRFSPLTGSDITGKRGRREDNGGWTMPDKPKRTVISWFGWEIRDYWLIGGQDRVRFMG